MPSGRIWNVLSRLFQSFWVQAGSMPVRGLFLPVLFHPGFPAFACGGIAAGKNESGDVGISDFLTRAAIFWQNANKRRCERRTSDSIEDVALEFCAVFLCKRDVAAIVECFFERFA